MASFLGFSYHIISDLSLGFLLHKVSILCVLPLWKADTWEDILSTGGDHTLFQCSKMCSNVLWREWGVQFLFECPKNENLKFAHISFNMFFYIYYFDDVIKIFCKVFLLPLLKNHTLFPSSWCLKYNKISCTKWKPTALFSLKNIHLKSLTKFTHVVGIEANFRLSWITCFSPNSKSTLFKQIC